MLKFFFVFSCLSFSIFHAPCRKKMKYIYTLHLLWYFTKSVLTYKKILSCIKNIKMHLKMYNIIKQHSLCIKNVLKCICLAVSKSDAPCVEQRCGAGGSSTAISFAKGFELVVPVSSSSSSAPPIQTVQMGDKRNAKINVSVWIYIGEPLLLWRSRRKPP